MFPAIQSFQAWLKDDVNTIITKVEYDWENKKVYITIADRNFLGPHEFDCNETWTAEDCETAINNKFK